jgi:hypothetical protein
MAAIGRYSCSLFLHLCGYSKVRTILGQDTVFRGVVCRVREMCDSDVDIVSWMLWLQKRIALVLSNPLK